MLCLLLLPMGACGVCACIATVLRVDRFRVVLDKSTIVIVFVGSTRAVDCIGISFVGV